VGTQTVHEYRGYNQNTPTTMGGAIPYANSCDPTTGNCLGNNSWTTYTPLGHGNYNSMQSTLRHRFAEGYLLTANYTWSKWMTDWNDYPGYAKFAKGLSGEDRTNNLNITGTAESPFGKGKPYMNTGVGAAILGGWQLNFIISATSGNPFTVGANSQLPFGFGTQFANKIKSGKVPISPRNISKYFDTSYFGSPNPTFNSFGNAGVNTLRGPGLFNVDGGFGRKVNIWRNVNLALRVDAFNVFNHAHFSGPASNVDAGYNFGQISGVAPYGGRFGLDQRQVRLGAHLDF
jgi:hypothetical protein